MINEERTTEYGYERLAEIQFAALARDLTKLDTRVGGLETRLNAGLTLLAGNMLALLISLAKTLLTHSN